MAPNKSMTYADVEEPEHEEGCGSMCLQGDLEGMTPLHVLCEAPLATKMEKTERRK